MLAILVFAVFWWISGRMWSAAIDDMWLPSAVVETAVAHANDEDTDFDDPRVNYSLFSVTINFLLAFWTYRWARRWRLSAREFALSWEVAGFATIYFATSISVTAAGLANPISGMIRDATALVLVFVGWRIYPWLARMAAVHQA